MFPKLRTAIGAVAFLCAGSSASLAADDQTFIAPLDRPDPKSVTVPSVALAPTQHDARQYDSYFYFYKLGVSYESAFFDLDQCRIFSLSSKLVATPPKFVPLGADIKLLDQRAAALKINILGQYGIVGGIIGGVMVENAMDDNDNATERRCMSYKGYSRYGTSRAIWNEINRGTAGEKVARMAIIASGAKPDAEAIEP